MANSFAVATDTYQLGTGIHRIAMNSPFQDKGTENPCDCDTLIGSNGTLTVIAPVTIAEPPSTALLGLGGLALILRRQAGTGKED